VTTLYLIDGDNLIGSWGGPRTGRDLRAEVVQRVAFRCETEGATAIVFFDHPPREPLPPLERVTVRVAAAGESADDLIRAHLDGEGRDTSGLTVVSSDKPVYSYARTRGAAILRAHEWNARERVVPS
jgi:predicted RNA-binding protein with PIN domain